MDLERVRKIAGLTEGLTTDASIDHVKKETKLFHDACQALTKVEQMAKSRLNNKHLLPEHKKQYTKLLKDAQDACAVMKAHLETYK